jgi:hypothetical protein
MELINGEFLLRKVNSESAYVQVSIVHNLESRITQPESRNLKKIHKRSELTIHNSLSNLKFEKTII